jgi:hypothetical protein
MIILRGRGWTYKQNKFRSLRFQSYKALFETPCIVLDGGMMNWKGKVMA